MPANRPALPKRASCKRVKLGLAARTANSIGRDPPFSYRPRLLQMLVMSLSSDPFLGKSVVRDLVFGPTTLSVVGLGARYS
jgi:hypothetical protein